MPAIGITGGISTGKSTFCECLGDILPGARFFDADRAARELVELEEVRRELVGAFGNQIFANGHLNRVALRAIVFADSAKKNALEKILHPRIRRQWSAEAETHRQSPDYFFADIPLLYETGGETLCDRVVVVACSPDVQLANFLERSKLDRATAEAMIRSQMPLEEKMKRADHVVWNNGGRAVLAEQAKLLVDLWQQEKWTKA
ncbi:MAG TPA: dephospho-CoA kinase [Chthoniobacterales bacterium]|nr:dephospho-CoA kinase [Chthoniobacterales bacterium]